jgi:type II secretory pathway component PulF
MTAVPIQFEYRAARRDGSLEEGSVGAASRDAAAALLAQRGLYPVDLRVADAAGRRRRRLPIADLSLGLRILGDLLAAGLPVSRALQAFEDISPPSWRDVVPVLAASVRDGKGLAAALAAAPVEMPPLIIGILHAGEAGSGLASAVRRAAELMEAMASRRAALRAALAYPCILAVAGTASLTLLVGVVLPRFAAILGDLGQELPVITRAVLAGAAVARASLLPMALATVVTVALWRTWTATEQGLVRWHSILLRVPLVGDVRRAAATARVAAATAALLESGVRVAPALAHAARTAGDAAIASRVLAARGEVVRGERVARAMASHDALTATAVRLIRAGEQTGQLAAMLAHAATIEGTRAEQRVRSSVRLLEPTLILAFGAFVALIAAALLQAIYSVRPGV